MDKKFMDYLANRLLGFGRLEVCPPVEMGLMTFENKLAAIVRFGCVGTCSKNGKFGFRPKPGNHALFGIKKNEVITYESMRDLVEDLFTQITAVKIS